MSSNTARDKEDENILASPAQDVMSLGYGLCPQMVFRDARLEPGAKAIYGYLASFAGAGMTAFPSQRLMLEELKMSRPTYSKHLKQLQAYGYVKVERRKNSRNEYMSNVYELVREPMIDDERMEAYRELRIRSLEASRLARRERNVSRDEARIDEIASILGSRELAERAMQAVFSDLDPAGKPPLSNYFTVEENPSSEPVSNNFTVDTPVSNIFTEPVSKNFTLANSVNSIKGKVTTYQPTRDGSQVEEPSEAKIEAGGKGSKGTDDTPESLRALLGISMKPVAPRRMEAVRRAYEQRIAEGYSESDIERSYEAYRAAYLSEHKTLKQAKQLDRWLVDGDGIISYAAIVGVGPKYRSGADPDADASTPVNNAERRALARASTEDLQEALARADSAFRALLVNLEQAKRSKDWGLAGDLTDQACVYLTRHRRQAVGEYLKSLRARARENVRDREGAGK